MLEILMITVQVVLFGGMIWSVWALCCNQKTYKQRGFLLHLEMDRDDRWKGLNMYSTASYDEHMKQLMFFRNPYKLYKLEKDVDR